MKSKISLLGLTMFVVGVLAFSVSPIVSAASFWKVEMASPNESINSKKFNIEYTTLSTESTDVINVELYQNGASIATKSTSKPYGDSGAFPVTVSGDGTYGYYLKATNSGNGEVRTTPTKQVLVDTSSTAAPIYGEVTREGNTYTVTFTAPDTGDVVLIRLFSSTSPDFTADKSTEVGSVTIQPGERGSITYTAPDSERRYHAVQAFDSAGNGSGLVGDPGTEVTQGLGGQVQGGGAAGGGADVLGNEDDKDEGTVDANGTSTDNKTEGQVSGDNKNADDDSSLVAWLIILGALAAVLGYANRDKISAALNRDKK